MQPLMSMFTSKAFLAVTACLICSSTLAIAQVGAPADVIHIRQQGFKDMGAALKTVRDQLKQSSPDMAAIRTASDTINATTTKLATWFPNGSGANAGIKTAAKAEIWSDAATFEKKRNELIAAAQAFAKLTASGDKATITAGVAPLSRTCKGCHDIFFEDDE